MAEKTEVTQEKPVAVNDGNKPSVTVNDEKTTTAPPEDKPGEKLESEDISDILDLLNSIQSHTGSNEKITDVPAHLRNSIRFLHDQLAFVKDLYEDPLYKALMDDLYDQKEDGQTPSVEVAVARTIPVDKLQSLAESEDYASAQSELANNLEASKKSKEEDNEIQANYQYTKQQCQKYCDKMGYGEEEFNDLFKFYLDTLKIMADGKISEAEFEKIDKMKNYDKDTGELKSQIQDQGSAKEVLPDQASVETAMQKQRPSPATSGGIQMGLGSMAESAYGQPLTDVTKIRGKGRRG